MEALVRLQPPASMTSFGLKSQIMSAITPRSHPPPQKKVQAFNCPRVLFSPNFNKSSPNLLSLKETMIKQWKKSAETQPKCGILFPS